LKGAPGSITDLARRLGRDRSAVTRDVALLERYGVIRVVEKPLPGHGKQKWVTPVAAAVELSARL
jgi:predicted transcriptional regulator